jgi:hypothetical protein
MVGVGQEGRKEEESGGWGLGVVCVCVCVRERERFAHWHSLNLLPAPTNFFTDSSSLRKWNVRS